MKKPLPKVDVNKLTIDDALQFMFDQSLLLGAFKADLEYLDDFKKTKVALLMNESLEKTAVAREQYALSHPEYEELLEAIKEANQEYHSINWFLKACEAFVEVWRAKQYANKVMENSTR